MKRLKTVPLLLFMHFYFMQQGGMCTLASELLVRAMCPIQFSFLQFDADADTYYSDTNRYLQVHSAFKSYCGRGGEQLLLEVVICFIISTFPMRI